MNTPMKAQVYIINFLVSLSIFGCLQNSSEKNLNGRWYEIENYGNARWEFYPDSLIITADTQEKVNWRADESKIRFNIPTFYQDSSRKFIDLNDKIVINYKLSNTKDRLFGTIKNLYGEHEFSLLKAKNYVEFLNKKYEIEFSLPKDDSAKKIENHKAYGLNVFLEYSNNTIIGKTELSENLDHLESDIKKFKDSIRHTGRSEVDKIDAFYDLRFHLRVFADKNISDSIITSCLPVTIKRKYSKFIEGFPERFREPVRDTLPIKIYRMYQSEEEVEFSNIKGKEIKSIANNVYY